MGSWGLAVALTLRGGQYCGPVGRRAGVAAREISTALDTSPARTRCSAGQYRGSTWFRPVLRR